MIVFKNIFAETLSMSIIVFRNIFFTGEEANTYNEYNSF